MTRRTLVAIGVVIALVIAFVGVLGWGFHEYVFSSRDDVDKATRAELVSSVVTLFAGTAVGVAAYSAWQNYQASQANLEVAQETLQAERNRVTGEQFARAIDQLGSGNDIGGPNREVRIGAVYSLEQVAKDWYARREVDSAWVIVEALSAYVRMNQKGWKQAYPTINMDTGVPLPSPTATALLDPVIETILDVLGRRADAFADADEERKPNLRGVDFEAMSISRRNLHHCDLSGSNFRYADLSHAILRDADLQWANLEGASLNVAKLQGAKLHEAIFCHLVIDEEGELVPLSRQDLMSRTPNDSRIRCYPNTHAYLIGADFEGVDLRNTYGLTVEQIRQARPVDPNMLPLHLQDEYRREVAHPDSEVQQ